MVAFLKRYWGRLIVALLLGWALLPLIQLIQPGAARRDGAVIEATINLIFVASQTFWISRVATVGGKVVTGRKWRLGLGAFGLVIYVVLLAYNLQNWENVSKGSALSWRAALLEAPMRVWLFGSLLGFLVDRGFVVFRSGVTSDRMGIPEGPKGRRRTNNYRRDVAMLLR